MSQYNYQLNNKLPREQMINFRPRKHNTCREELKKSIIYSLQELDQIQKQKNQQQIKTHSTRKQKSLTFHHFKTEANNLPEQKIKKSESMIQRKISGQSQLKSKLYNKSKPSINQQMKKSLQLKVEQAYSKLKEIKESFNVRKVQKDFILSHGVT